MTPKELLKKNSKNLVNPCKQVADNLGQKQNTPRLKKYIPECKKLYIECKKLYNGG